MRPSKIIRFSTFLLIILAFTYRSDAAPIEYWSFARFYGPSITTPEASVHVRGTKSIVNELGWPCRKLRFEFAPIDATRVKDLRLTVYVSYQGPQAGKVVNVLAGLPGKEQIVAKRVLKAGANVFILPKSRFTGSSRKAVVLSSPSMAVGYGNPSGVTISSINLGGYSPVTRPSE